MDVCLSCQARCVGYSFGHRHSTHRVTKFSGCEEVDMQVQCCCCWAAPSPCVWEVHVTLWQWGPSQYSHYLVNSPDPVNGPSGSSPCVCRYWDETKSAMCKGHMWLGSHKVRSLYVWLLSGYTYKEIVSQSGSMGEWLSGWVIRVPVAESLILCKF